MVCVYTKCICVILSTITSIL
uniref:Uncharacterized protein n=1 Tax=Anguilla anguilla TaxID=7936 RepID=A0A0E9S7W9_ANGAN